MRSVRVGLFLLLAFCACEETKVPSAPGTGVPQPDSGPRPDSGMSYMRDSGTDSGMTPSLGPKVTIISPMPARDPNADELITEPTVKVSCKVERAARSGAAAVDKTSVKIGLQRIGEDDEEIWTEPPVNAAAEDTYEAVFEVRALANGPLQFRCVARDLATVPNSTTARLETLLDLGPKVMIEDPTMPSYALKTPVPIKFKVEASPVVEGDAEASIDTVTLLVSGVEIEVQEDASTPGLYQTSVDFDDRTQFPVPPNAAQVTITATNKRSPKSVARSSKVDIVLDGDGPTINVKAPSEGEIMQGNESLQVEVTDPSGVNASSLVANFNQGLLVIDEWDGVAPVFSQSFNTRIFSNKLTRLSIMVSAKDGVGNESTVTRIVKLDNLPPVISMTPPLIREWRNTGTRLECSALFDPIGDAPNDGDAITSYGYFRVLVEDKTNQPDYGPNDPLPITYLAGVNHEAVEIYMQRDASMPFLVDTDGNGICDEIHGRGEEIPEAQRPRKIKLAPVNPVGTPWYRIQDATSGDNASCYAETTAMPPITQPARTPQPCLSSPLDRVVPGRSSGRPPAVFALNPTNNSTGACTGDYWELTGIATPGWICLAARAEDNKENVGVSEPVRLCYGGGDCSGMPMPTCRTDCTISDAQKFQHTDGMVQWYFP